MKKVFSKYWVALLGLVILWWLHKIGRNLSNLSPSLKLKGNIGVDVVENEDLIRWQSLLEIWDKEADRFWARSNIFLLVNGALLVAVTSFSSAPIIGAATSLFGIFFVSIWIKVNIIGKFYLDRWKILLQEIEKSWDIQYVGRLGELLSSHRVASRLRASTTYMLYVLRLMLVLWLMIFIHESLLFVYQNQEFFQQIFMYIQHLPER